MGVWRFGDLGETVEVEVEVEVEEEGNGKTGKPDGLFVLLRVLRAFGRSGVWCLVSGVWGLEGFGGVWDRGFYGWKADWVAGSVARE